MMSLIILILVGLSVTFTSGWISSVEANPAEYPFRCDVNGSCKCNSENGTRSPLLVEFQGATPPIQLYVDQRYMHRGSRKRSQSASAFFELRADSFLPWPDGLLDTTRAIPNLKLVFNTPIDRTLPGSTSAEIYLRNIAYHGILGVDKRKSGGRPFQTVDIGIGINRIAFGRTRKTPSLNYDYFIDSATPATNLIVCLREKRHPKGRLTCRHHTDFGRAAATLTYYRSQLTNWQKIREGTAQLLSCFGYGSVKGPQ
jgi:hypothetical protein